MNHYIELHGGSGDGMRRDLAPGFEPSPEITVESGETYRFSEVAVEMGSLTDGKPQCQVWHYYIVT